MQEGGPGLTGAALGYPGLIGNDQRINDGETPSGGASPARRTSLVFITSSARGG
jgi:hypothetical protein